MNNTPQVTDTIIAQGILPLYFNANENVSIEVLRALYRAGVKAIEYTNRGAEALSNFTKMVVVRNAEMPELMLGVGSVENVAQAEDYLTPGADF